jgi:hypothetical protein
MALAAAQLPSPAVAQASRSVPQGALPATSSPVPGGIERVRQWQGAPLVELQGDEPFAKYLILRFMQGHPDLFWRLRGRELYAKGEHVRAREAFERAASYADKPSQAMLAEMHWEGVGGPRDPALGDAWMDLAAERYYEDFYILRERYWARLDSAGRKRALERGRKLLRKYGDEKTKPRLARTLVRERPNRVAIGGFFGNLPIIPPSGAGRDPITLRGSEYFDGTFWDPEAYFAWQDTIWNTLLTTGTVDVGQPKPMSPPVEEWGVRQRRPLESRPWPSSTSTIRR